MTDEKKTESPITGGRADLAEIARSAREKMRVEVHESRQRAAHEKEVAPLRDTIYVMVETYADGRTAVVPVSGLPAGMTGFAGTRGNGEEQALRLFRGCYVDALVKGRICHGPEARGRARTANLEIMDRRVEMPEVPKILGVVGSDVGEKVR